jgi:hypothetical protein
MVHIDPRLPALLTVSLDQLGARLTSLDRSDAIEYIDRADCCGVARIGEDQVADYAERRGLGIEKARQYLRPNLNE